MTVAVVSCPKCGCQFEARHPVESDVKMYKGSPPKKEGSKLLYPGVAFGHLDIWLLEKRKSKQAHWHSFKLVAVAGKMLPGKANWWIQFSSKEGRFARSKDAGMLKEHQPAYYNAVLLKLREHFNWKPPVVEDDFVI